MKEIRAHSILQADYIRRNLFEEDDEIVLCGLEELTYDPISGTPYVEFYLNGFFSGILEVWNDSSSDEDPEREYVTINHTIQYLDEIGINT